MVKRERHGKRLKRFLTEGRISIASFTSETSFANFIEIVGEEARPLLVKTAIAVMSPETARAVEAAGLRVNIVPAEATVRALVKAIIEWVASARQPSSNGDAGKI